MVSGSRQQRHAPGRQDRPNWRDGKPRSGIAGHARGRATAEPADQNPRKRPDLRHYARARGKAARSTRLLAREPVAFGLNRPGFPGHPREGLQSRRAVRPNEGSPLSLDDIAGDLAKSPRAPGAMGETRRLQAIGVRSQSRLGPERAAVPAKGDAGVAGPPRGKRAPASRDGGWRPARFPSNEECSGRAVMPRPAAGERIRRDRRTGRSHASAYYSPQRGMICEALRGVSNSKSFNVTAPVLNVMPSGVKV